MTREEKLKSLLDTGEYDFIKYIPKENMWKLIFALEYIQPTKNVNDWIPVSERLPEDSELVLFSTKTDRVFTGRYFDDDIDFQWYAFRDETFVENNIVTAWMPLPEPYKAESEVQE